MNDTKEIELERVKAERDQLKLDLERASSMASQNRLTAEHLLAERDHWKANHDNQVAIKAALLDRPDLQDRAKRVQQLIAERDDAVKALEPFAEITRLYGEGFKDDIAVYRAGYEGGPVDIRITLGHCRAARAFVEKVKQ